MSPPDVIGFARLALPDRVAIRAGDRAWTYRQLESRARRLARRLRDRGLAPGDRVAILSHNDIAHFDLLIAAPIAGIVVVPLNTRLSQAELAAQVALVQPALLLVDPAHEALGIALGLALGLATIRLSDHERWLADAPTDRLQPIAAPRHADDLHLILFTGGSTGQPKAACLPYRQTLGNADDSARHWRLRADDVAIQSTPCFHAAANVLSLPLLRIGGTVLLMKQFEPAEYLRQAVAHRASILFMVPTMFAAVADAPGFADADLSAVRLALSGGAPCPPSVRDPYRARGIRFRCGFGMTEAGVNCFQGGDPAIEDPQVVGLPMPRLLAEVRRADGVIAAIDEVGELCLAGPQVCAGYWGEPEGGHSFRDGWLHTGDLARRNAAGRYTICGRIKEMYISGGENVYPPEVEAALLQEPGIAEACVFGWPDARWGEVGIAFVVARAGAVIDGSALRGALRSRLAGYKIPALIAAVPALPRSAVGKVLKAEARAQYAAMLGEMPESRSAVSRFGNAA
ncbi:AMP-binding protein [Nevskia sp.]|uniref:class I adenylate-forming enzyme family protein n=1 Tax=Nevskia sp. TaxID=1929292 RepID=UPI0025D4FB02|nr:AMP-binding protein [Nevskia sp.]